jgi:hypothetical protein
MKIEEIIMLPEKEKLDQVELDRLIKLFSFLPDTYRNERLDKFEFNSIPHIPTCTKYKKPKNIKFIQADEMFCSWKMICLSVEIKMLFQLEESHFLCLHPIRYDLVKRAIAAGEIDMPIVYLCEAGFPRVEDGRHRIMALYQFGFTHVDIIVPDEQLKIIKPFLIKAYREI